MRRHDLSHSPYLYHADAVVLCLVTIGPKLEAAVEAYKRDGQLGRALVLDTYGSAAVESAADFANTAIEDELTAKGNYCSPRYSPGYACWDVKEQTWILPTLEGEELGIKLTEGCMMVPRKSISFAVTYADSPVESEHKHDCAVCGMIDCLYERTD
jgi:cobalamin-dependent methionine synthase I